MRVVEHLLYAGVWLQDANAFVEFYLGQELVAEYGYHVLDDHQLENGLLFRVGDLEHDYDVKRSDFVVFVETDKQQGYVYDEDKYLFKKCLLKNY